MGLFDGNLPGLGFSTDLAVSVNDTEETEVSKSSTWNLISESLKGLDSLPKPGDYTAFVRSYTTLVWIYVTVWILSTSIASIPLRVMTGDRNKPTEVDFDDPIYKLLQEPNPDESMSELIEELVVYLELTGCGYWEKVMPPKALRAYKDVPMKLYNLESHMIEVKDDPVEKISKFIWGKDTNTKGKSFQKEQVCQFRYPNPLSQFYGMGFVQPLQTTIITELYRELYNKSYFENEARPDIALIHNPDLNKGIAPLQPAAMKRLAAAWQKAFGGPKKKRLPVVLDSGTDIKILSDVANRDMDFREMEKSLRERILAASGVFPAMVGLISDQNYGNAKEQVKLFWTVTVPPKCRRIANTITRQIVRPYNEKYWCEFDDSIIKALEESPKEHEERLSRILERGGISLGEYRRGNGYEVDENDKHKDLRIITTNVVPLDDFVMSYEEPKTEKPAGGTGTGAEGSQEGGRQFNEQEES